MSKRYRECYDPLCCPVGLREHIANYRNQRHNPPEYRAGFFGYWFWEFKSLIGLNTVLCFDCEDGECKKHIEPPLTLSQRLMRALRLHGRSQNASGDPKRKANT